MTTKEMIAVMKAFTEGKQIERKRKCGIKWVDCDHPGWEWSEFEYRVKPEEVKPEKKELVCMANKRTVPYQGLWTVKETAAFLGITVKALYLRIHRGTVPYIKMGNNNSQVRFDPEELQSFVDRCRVPVLEASK